jgi:hypothetical protein
MKIKLVQEDGRLLVVFNQAFLDQFGMTADTAFEVSVEDGAVVLQPMDSRIRFDGMVATRISRTEFEISVT